MMGIISNRNENVIDVVIAVAEYRMRMFTLSRHAVSAEARLASQIQTSGSFLHGVPWEVTSDSERHSSTPTSRYTQAGEADASSD